jgi:hypothetical protein
MNLQDSKVAFLNLGGPGPRGGLVTYQRSFVDGVSVPT